MILALLSTALLSLPLTRVSGQAPTGFTILQVTEQGGYSAITSGIVGQPISVIATINTYNGGYKMWFADELVDSGTSAGYYISSNFSIPQMPAGDYNLTLMDVTLNINTTAPFTVETHYGLQILVPLAPALLQEGDNVVLNITVTAGTPNTAYTANVTVKLPEPAATIFERIITLTTSPLGTAQSQLTFPDPSFQPLSGEIRSPTTIYAGSYDVYFNETENIAQDGFLIGFTEFNSYHRGETMKIRAVGYQPSQTATLTAEYGASSPMTQSVTADDQGVITYAWTIPDDAAIGSYTVNITAHANPKAVPDSAQFTIPGYLVNLRALNLAEEIVPDIFVAALDQATGRTYNGTTDVFGETTIGLEKGNSTLIAYWNDVEVGRLQLTVSGNATRDISCKLANLKIVVQDKNGVVIPFANLNIFYQYTATRTGIAQTGNVSGQTDLTGTTSFNSTLPGITYTINASKFGVVFNMGNNTVSNLPAQPTVQVTILCPDETLTLTTVDYDRATLPNARIELIEQASGIFYGATTDSNGKATVQVTFGQYRLRVYTSDNILLDESIINVISNTQREVRCALYNLDITVKVVDYFGNPVSGVTVQLSRTGMSTQTATTQGDGTWTFSRVIGGNVEITAFPAGNEKAFVARYLRVESPTTVQLQMANYVSLGGMLVDLGALASIIIIIVVVLLFVILEVFRRRGFKLRRHSES